MAYVIRWCGLIGLATLVIALTVVHPHVLAANEFLHAFVSHEMLALLIVILTITLASIGNIHLTLSRIVRRFKSHADGELAAAPARQELDSNAWSLFWAFVACVVVLLIKGGFPTDVYIVSLMNGFALIILAFNMAVLHDIYSTVFDLVRQDSTSDEHKPDA
ncbi:hypothetical protein GGR90_003574 [Sphingopyxis italica]|uniref:Uncharacterized protein n=1 Tax=Sphingopyxis italica TaxID=1129133 RepID=A0A7X5XU67_9SPHN|nr:hypothetical protein [Sphingopyxis italica]NJB91365.1 hypothetical protein [Sphingopyxis italica]